MPLLTLPFDERLARSVFVSDALRLGQVARARHFVVLGPLAGLVIVGPPQPVGLVGELLLFAPLLFLVGLVLFVHFARVLLGGLAHAPIGLLQLGLLQRPGLVELGLPLLALLFDERLARGVLLGDALRLG